MKANLSKKIYFAISCCLAIIIIYSPTLILGHGYSEYINMGVVLAGEVVMRITTLMVGMLVIYDAIKTYLK